MKKLFFILLSLFIVLYFSGTAIAGKSCEKSCKHKCGAEMSKHSSDETDSTAKDVICNMTVNKKDAKFKHEYKAKTYYFCSEDCMNKFKNEPDKYSKKISDNETVKDLVCNMNVKTKEAKFKHKYNGKTYYFCSKECLKEFKKNPEKYIEK